MIKLHKTITINAPVEKVFAYMNDPHHLPEIWPSMVEIKDVKSNPKGGYDFGWVYKMAGMKFDGASVATENILNQRIGTQSKKGIESKFVWVFTETANNDTKLTVDIEYNIPIPLIGKIAEAIILKENDREADTLLANLKNKMEISTLMPA